MKLFWSCLILLSLGWSLKAQDTPKKVVEVFFEAFHAKDTLTLNRLMTQTCELKSISIRKGNTKQTTETVEDFLNALIKIPQTIKFEELILSYSEQQDQLLASVWTPYEFYINNLLSHTGHNLFILTKQDQKWLISGVYDSRIYD